MPSKKSMISIIPMKKKSETLNLNLLKEVEKSYKEDISINVGCYIKKKYERFKNQGSEAKRYIIWCENIVKIFKKNMLRAT